MKLPLLARIWTIEGKIGLDPAQAADEVFDRLDPLFRQYGTSVVRRSDSLTFSKVDPAAQDKMSVFDSGTLWVDGSAEPVLRYSLTSRILLLCFLAPLLFLALAQLTVQVGKWQGAKPEKAAAAEAAKEKKVVIPLNPIDKALGAPAPEQPDKTGKKKGGRDRKPTPTAGYVFAGIFATLYIVGRLLEDRLIKRLFAGRLQEPSPEAGLREAGGRSDRVSSAAALVADR